jgi:phenylalanyl-tRNA synthetase beta chain
MRSTLVPTLLRIARDNLHRQADEIRLFEVARTFRLVEQGSLPEERLIATLVITRPIERSLWDDREPIPLFFIAKGMVERLLGALGRDLRLQIGGNEPYLHPGASCEIASSHGRVGVMGELHPACAARFEIQVPCAIVELDLSAAAKMPTGDLKYSEVSRFPLMRRDLAVLLDRHQKAGEVLEAIRQKAGAHLTDVEIFDRYDGEGVPEGRISLAFRLTYQRADRTLTDAEVTKATDRVVQMLAKRFGGELR